MYTAGGLGRWRCLQGYMAREGGAEGSLGQRPNVPEAGRFKIIQRINNQRHNDRSEQ